MSDELEQILNTSPPRPIPMAVRNGPYGRVIRNWAGLSLVIGVSCLALRQLGWLTQLSYYFLPLGYLEYFAVFWLILGIIHALRWLGTGGRYRILRRGELCSGVVSKIETVPTGEVHGRVVSASLRVTVRPEGEPFGLKSVRVETPAFPLARSTVSLKDGQVVTLLYEPDDRYSFQILESLGLFESGGIVSTKRPRVPVWSALLFLLLTCSAVLWNWASHYETVGESGSFDGACFGAALAAGVLCLLTLNYLMSRHYPHLSPTTRDYASYFLGAFFIGLFLSLVSLRIVNGYATDAPLEYRKVEAKNVIQTTHSFVVRDYRLDYLEEPGGDTKSVGLWPSQLPSGKVTETTLVTKMGRLGWPFLVDVRFECGVISP